METDQPSQPVQDHKKFEEDQRLWAVFCHLSALSMLIGIPLGNIWVPLILWVLKKKDMPLVEEAGRESINFQISLTIYTVISFILCFIFVGFLLIFPLLLFNVGYVIYASIKVSNGERFRYPLTIRFIK